MDCSEYSVGLVLTFIFGTVFVSWHIQTFLSAIWFERLSEVPQMETVSVPFPLLW